MSTEFTFDHGFQRSVLRLMMIDPAFEARALRWIEPGHFTTPALGWIYRVMAEYHQQWSGQASDMVLRDAARKLPEDKAARYASEVELVIQAGNVPEAAWIRAQLTGFIQQALFARAHGRSAELFNAGQTVDAYDATQRAMEQIREVSFEADDRIWLFDELEPRNRARLRESLAGVGTGFTTGLPDLDKMSNGGVQPGEIWVVFAYAKRAKTTWLINQGFHSARIHRRPFVYFALEGSGKQIAARFDACFSTELYSKVKAGRMSAALYAELSREYESLKQLGVIRTINDWGVNILHLEQELKDLRTTYGFIPQMMIVDYMDLGRSRDRVDSETAHQVAFARDFKTLINRTEMAGWSAWQAQRPRKGAHTTEHLLSSSDVADAYAKVRIVDAFGSLNATDEELKQGTMRVFFEGYRDGMINKVWRVENDLSRMRMMTSSVEYLGEGS